MDTDAQVGARVRAARIRAGYRRREDLTDQLRLPRFGAKVLGQVERNERPLYEHEAEALANVLNVDGTSFYGTEGRPLELAQYVAELKAEIADLKATVNLDINEQNRLLAWQSDLLEQQTKLLTSIRQENASLREEGAQIREALRLLPAVQRLLEAEAEAAGPQPVERPALADGEDRRAGEDRRRTG